MSESKLFEEIQKEIKKNEQLIEKLAQLSATNIIIAKMKKYAYKKGE